MADIGDILTGVAGIGGVITNAIFSGMNYNSQQETNDFNKNQMWGQNSQIFDTLMEHMNGKYSTFSEAYLDQVHNSSAGYGNWTERLNKQDALTMLQLDREDSALQRKVNDARQAHINPYYALGGSGAPASSYTSGTPGMNMQAPKFDMVNDFSNLANILSGLEVRQEQAKLLSAQAEKTLAETGKIELETILTGENIGVAKEQQNKLREEILLIRSNIKVSDAQFEKFMQEVSILQYDLLKSIEFDMRYKDQMNLFSFSLSKLDKMAGDITSSETSKDMLMGLAIGLAGIPLATKYGKKAVSLFSPLFKKYGNRALAVSDDFSKFNKKAAADMYKATVRPSGSFGYSGGSLGSPGGFGAGFRPLYK